MRRLTSLSSLCCLTLTAAAAAACVAGTSGCQAHINGQTLPSAYYLRDDIQYFPAGPEFQLTNQKQALEEYRARRAGVGQ